MTVRERSELHVTLYIREVWCVSWKRWLLSFRQTEALTCSTNQNRANSRRINGKCGISNSKRMIDGRTSHSRQLEFDHLDRLRGRESSPSPTQ